MKLDKQTIGMRYGKALFELAEEKGQLETIQTEMKELQIVFIQNPTLASALTDVRLNNEQKKNILRELEEGMSELTRNFLGVLFETKRLSGIVCILENFLKRYNEAKGIVTGKVTTAIALTPKQKEQIVTGMSRRLQVEKMQLEEIVDETIIGGVIVEAANQIIDGSVRTQMTKLQNLLQK